MTGGKVMNKILPFYKIYARDNVFQQTKNRFKYGLKKFEVYATYLTLKSGKAKGNSGKAKSYVNYLVRAIIFYEKIFNNEFPPFHTIEAFTALDKLRNIPNYNNYNQAESRFPNAAINCFHSFVIHSQSLEEHQLDNELDIHLYTDTPSPIIRDETVIYKATKRPEKVSYNGKVFYPRNQNESLKSKVQNNWKCEVDNSHRTFID